MVPEWAPSIHPLVVHFPVALLVVACGVDVLAFFIKGRPWLLSAANGLYALGALAAVAAFFSGRQGADALVIPTDAMGTLTDHADWALRTAWLYGLVGLARLGLLRDTGAVRGTALHAVCLFVGAAGLGLLYQTGDLGAELVYRYGVGVQAMKDRESPEGEGRSLATNPPTASAPVAKKDAQVEGITEDLDPKNVAPLWVDERGAWAWGGNAQGLVQLQRDFTWLAGDPESMPPVLAGDQAASWVRLDVTGRAFFVAGGAVGHVQAVLVVDADGFEGTIRLVHHVNDAANYNYMELADGMVRLGEVVEGENKVQDETEFALRGWQSLKVVGHKTHFRAYVDDEMVAHGHGPELPAGRVGIAVEGKGVLKIKRLIVEPLE